MKQASFPTNHNFYGEEPLKTDEEIIKAFNAKKNQIRTTKELFNGYTLTTKSNSLEQLPIYRFKPRKNHLEESEEQLILRLYSRDSENGKSEYIVETGLFAGVVYHKGCEFNITCRGGEVFLRRMLNFLNDVYVDTQETDAQSNNENNAFQHIITYLFIHSLERSATLGLPHLYQKVTQCSHKVRGSVDMNAYFRNDIPFMGKLTTTYREQRAIQPIVDVLFLACDKIRKNFGAKNLQPIANIYQALKTDYSGQYPSKATLRETKNHRVLAHPVYSSFRTTLEYADIILNNLDLQAKQNAKQATHGYLFDISQLFEIYLEKLISRYFKDWTVTGQEQLNVYGNRFFSRNMYPDIVMQNNKTGKVIVFDAKFKQMRQDYRDLDRADFYQIHTYMSYYSDNLLLGGLLYPLINEHNSEISHSESLFDLDDSRPRFIVDGIKISTEMKLDDIHKNETAFLKRIKDLIDPKQISEVA